MKNLFIITSAIFGVNVENPVSRLTQLLHTIDSINYRVPSCDIIVLEMGTSELPEWATNFWPKNVNLYNYQSVKDIIKLREDSNILFKDELQRIGYIKSGSEFIGLDMLISSIDLKQYENVFKISGRYFLNDRFNLENFNGNISFKKIERGDSSSVLTVLYSFKGSYSEIFIKMYKESKDWFFNQSDMSNSVDLESSLWNSSQGCDINWLDQVGVMGIVNYPGMENRLWQK